MGKRAKRKNYLILPKFQIRFILCQLISAFLAGGVFYGAIRYFFWQFASLGTAVGLPPDHVFFQFLGEQLKSMNLIFLVSAVIMAIALIVHGIFMSHRVAGPIYHMEKELDRLANGEDYRELRFRKGDYFQSLATKHNRAMKKLLNKDKAA